jgi:hypothetical protein
MLRFDRGSANGRNRRNLAVAVRTCDGPFTIWFADLQVVRCKPAVWRVGDLRPGKPPESKLNGREGNEGAQGFGKILEVPGETPVASEPGEGALDHPAARQDDKALPVVARLNDLRAQSRYSCHRSVNLPGV